MIFNEIGKLEFHDRLSDDNAFIMVRTAQEIINVLVTLEHDGDLDIWLVPEARNNLVNGLEKALTFIGDSYKDIPLPIGDILSPQFGSRTFQGVINIVVRQQLILLHFYGSLRICVLKENRHIPSTPAGESGRHRGSQTPVA